MPYGYDPILTSFTSITTSSSNCSGEGTKRIYQGLWRMSDVEGRANIALRVARSVARRRQLHWLRVTRIMPLTLYPDGLCRPPASGAGAGPLSPLPGTTSARARGAPWPTRRRFEPSSSPSAIKSLILQIESECRQFARHSRRLASPSARIPN